MFTASFWKDTAERVIGTAAALGIAYFSTVGLSDTWDATWQTGLLSIGIGTGVTFLKCLVGGRRADTISPASIA
jgi:hypothetical protein